MNKEREVHGNERGSIVKRNKKKQDRNQKIDFHYFFTLFLKN